MIRAVAGPARALLAVVLLIPCPGAAAAETASTVQRLGSLARLWGYVKYHHPTLAHRPDLDWDAALVAAIPQVSSARSTGDFAAALREMLEVLEDPRTRIHRTESGGGEGDQADGPGLGTEITDDGILLVRARDYLRLSEHEGRAAIRKAIEAIPSARAVVLDVRAARDSGDYGRFQLTATLDAIERRITTEPIVLPGERRRVFYGIENASPFASGQYRTGFLTRFGSTIRPSPDARDLPCVVLVNENGTLPRSATSLQARGKGLILFEGNPGRYAPPESERIELGEGLAARVRVTEPVHPDGRSARLIPDAVVNPPVGGESEDPALTVALHRARGFKGSTLHLPSLPATAPAPVERSYREMEFPSREYRLLGLFRFWNAMHYFHPYKDLLDRSWDEVLEELIPRFEAAGDAEAYALAVAGMARELHDSHAYVAGRVFTEKVIGEGFPPIRVRWIEEHPVVTAIFDPSAGEAGARTGDVVTRVDGEDARARLERYAGYFSASTDQSLMDKATLNFMNGPVGSKVALEVEREGGRTASFTLERRKEDYTTLYHRERAGDIVRLLPANIGYVDLDRLDLSMVDEVFEQLGSTRAIIFDMRGYPKGTIWAIAPRLTSSQPRVAFFETPIVGHGSPGTASEAFYQAIAPTPEGVQLYTGLTVMLVDERSQSQAEHTGMTLQAANGTLLVGSPSAGANGELASITLPGGITVGFTAQSVRFPDGRQLQRKGMQPDLFVRPTIEGIRQGRDEVLEAAIELVERELK